MSTAKFTPNFLTAECTDGREQQQLLRREEKLMFNERTMRFKSTGNIDMGSYNFAQSHMREGARLPTKFAFLLVNPE